MLSGNDASPWHKAGVLCWKRIAFAQVSHAIIFSVNDIEGFPHQVLRRNQASGQGSHVTLAFPSTSHAVLPTHLVSGELKDFNRYKQTDLLFHMVADLF
jgi:hypothetical protein